MRAWAKSMVDMKGDWSGHDGARCSTGRRTEPGTAAMVEDGLWTKHGVPTSDYFIRMHTAPGPVW